MRRSYILGLVVVAACAVCAVVFVRSRSDPQISGMSAAELYDEIGVAMDRPGMNAVVRYQRERSPTGGYPAETTTIWIDAHNDLARVESTYDHGSFGESGTTTILRDSHRYGAGKDGAWSMSSNERCPELGLRALTTLGTCYDVPDEAEKFESHVEEGREFDGRSALALVTKGSYSGIDSTITVNNVLYIDPETMLPIALKVTGKDRMLGHTSEFISEKQYAVEFVAAETLAPDFFEAPPIVEIENDPERPLFEHPPAYPVYWLGRDFVAVDGLPGLYLNDFHIVEQDVREEVSTVTFSYASADNEFSPPSVSLSNWPRERRDPFVSTGAPPPHRADPCAPPEHAETVLGPATLHTWSGSGSCDASLSYTVEVDTGATVLVMTGSAYGMPSGMENPYASREALERLVAAFVVR